MRSGTMIDDVLAANRAFSDAHERRDLAAVAEIWEHHLVHEGGWTLTMTPDRTATWTRPDGQAYWTGSLNDRRPIAA